MDKKTYAKAEYFYNRELSWLKFNSRVLQEADHAVTPLLDRLRFIAIVSSNLDEFFMIRVAGLKQQHESGVTKTDTSGLTVSKQLTQISKMVHDQVQVQYRYLQNIVKELEKENICFCKPNDLQESDREWLRDYYVNTLYPVLTPMAVDAGHPFPFLASRSLNLAVRLKKGEEHPHMAVLPVPTVLPRLLEIPGNDKVKRFVFLEDILELYCQTLFQGYTILGMAPFRITRNADLSIDEEEAEDLLAEVEKSLQQRRRGQPVRLEIGRKADEESKNFIIRALRLGKEDVYQIKGHLDLTVLMKFADLPGWDHLRYPRIVSQIPQDLLRKENMDLFSAIREKDIFLHHPFESFDPVVDFIVQASRDPQVLAIKQTLYRVGGNSPIVQALAEAASNGKQVTVLVELKARFDEENNILWARRLEEAGCHVIYGLVGLKTHSKCTLVVRQESDGIRRYVHVGTGNYNNITAKLYTDVGIMTANDQIGMDASAFFNLLSGYSDPPVWNKFIVAPLGMRETILRLIDREMRWAEAGYPAHIVAKMNSLLDPEVISKLYEAAHKGVVIDLIIRGICVLRTGIPDISEKIHVRSIVGRFLEHSRLFYFANRGEEDIFLSSADWMPRNLDKRVELMIPVTTKEHKERVKEILALLLADNQKSHMMKKDGTYFRKSHQKKQEVINAQARLMQMATEASSAKQPTVAQLLRPCTTKR